MAADEHRGGLAKYWTVKIRLAIETTGSSGARTVTEETLQQMGLARPRVSHC